MTHHNPISLSVEDLNNVDLSVEDLNNIDLSAEDAHKITLSVIDWFYTQILNAIVALASVALGAEAVMSTVSKIIGAAGVGLSGTANVVSPSKVNASAGVSVGASGVAAVRSLLVAQSGAQFGAQVAARCPAIIIGLSGMGMGATAELDAGAVIWTPAQLGSSVLKLWLDANDESTITKDGSNYVSQWNDKSGNGKNVTQGTGAYQPLYDGDDQSVNFYEDAMNLPSVSAKAGIAVVRNVNGGTFNGSICALIGTFFNKSSICLRRSDYTISLDIGDDSDSGDASVNGGVLTPGDGTGTNISILGFTPFPLHNEPDMTYWQINTVRSFDRLANHWAEFYRSKIDFHELLLFSDALSTSDRQKCEGYLAHKWGYASKLPVDHPYKTNPPTV